MTQTLIDMSRLLAMTDDEYWEAYPDEREVVEELVDNDWTLLEGYNI